MSAHLDAADRVWPDDPPFDVVSMLEVCDDARRNAISAREHAVKMMVPFALRAILDGRDPREVAKACGFGESSEPDVDVESGDDVDEVRSVYVSLFGRQAYGRPDPLAGFMKWLQDGLAALIKDAA